MRGPWEKIEKWVGATGGSYNFQITLPIVRTVSSLNHRQTLFQLKTQARLLSREYEKLGGFPPKSSKSSVIKRRSSQLFSNPREHFNFLSRFLCFQTANQEKFDSKKLSRAKAPPFSSPEPTILLVCGRNRELWEQPFQACVIDADAQ